MNQRSSRTYSESRNSKIPGFLQKVYEILEVRQPPNFSPENMQTVSSGPLKEQLSWSSP